MNEVLVKEEDKLVLLAEGIKQIKKFQKAKLQLGIMEEELKKMFLEKMEETGISKYESPDGTFKVTYVKETTSHTFNTKKFKEDHKELYDVYVSETTKKAYVRIS